MAGKRSHILTHLTAPSESRCEPRTSWVQSSVALLSCRRTKAQEPGVLGCWNSRGTKSEELGIRALKWEGSEGPEVRAEDWGRRLLRLGTEAAGTPPGSGGGGVFGSEPPSQGPGPEHPFCAHAPGRRAFLPAQRPAWRLPFGGWVADKSHR